MKIHILPGQQYMELLHGIIESEIGNQQSAIPDLDSKIPPQAHRIIEHSIRIAESCRGGHLIGVSSADCLLAAILLATAIDGSSPLCRRYLESKGITLEELCQVTGLPIERIRDSEKPNIHRGTADQTLKKTEDPKTQDSR